MPYSPATITVKSVLPAALLQIPLRRSLYFTPNPAPPPPFLPADETKLRADIPDAVRFVVRLLDQAGNELPYSSEIVQIKLKGPAKVVGPQEFSLIGGARGFWIKTLGKAGTVKVSVQSGEFKSETVSVRIR